MARIYISSTYQDLVDERNLVCAAIRSQRHEAIAMEDYVAEGTRPVKKCLQDVADCQIYIGVFAWRYGFVPEEDNSDRLSITELEYREARRLGRETLVFLQKLKSANPELMDANTGENDQGERIKRFRSDLMKAPGAGIVKEFGSPEELRSWVLEALPGALARLPPAGPAPDEAVKQRHEALRELAEIGNQILKLCALKQAQEKVLELYADTSLLRTDVPRDVSAKAIRKAIDKAQKKIEGFQECLDDCKDLLDAKEEDQFRKQVRKVGEAKQGLEVLLQDAPVAEDERERRIVEFNEQLWDWLSKLTSASLSLWKQLRLTDLPVVLDKLTGLPFLNRIRDGYGEISTEPPLFSKSGFLHEERKMLQEAENRYAELWREFESEDCDIGAITRRWRMIGNVLAQAKKHWDGYLALNGRRDSWEELLLADGETQWREITDCQAKTDGAISQAGREGDQVPSGVVDALRNGRRVLEEHLRSLDDALGEVYVAVNEAIGKPVKASMGGADEQRAQG